MEAKERMTVRRIWSLLLLLSLLVGCTSRTEFGDCIGAFSDGDPGLRYEVSAWNIVLGIIFVETVIVPVFVVLDETMCPVARVAP